MPIELYYHAVSPPCRSIMLAAEILGVELSLKEIQLWKGEHKTPEYLKLNPQHTIPTMVDDGLVLTESRAIVAYLANKYGNGGSLYPGEASARALVDQRLYFDIGTLYQRYADYAYPQLFSGQPADEEKLKKFEEALGFLETFLERSKFVAGPHLTLADLCIAITVSNSPLIGFDLSKYAKISAWLENVKKAVPAFQEIYDAGVEAFQGMMKAMKK